MMRTYRDRLKNISQEQRDKFLHGKFEQEYPLLTQGSEKFSSRQAMDALTYHRKTAGVPGSPYPNGKLLETEDFLQHMMAGGTVVTKDGREYKIPIGIDPRQYVDTLEKHNEIKGHKVTDMWYDEANKIEPELVMVDNTEGVKLSSTITQPEGTEYWLVRMAMPDGSQAGIKLVNNKWTIIGDLDESARQFIRMVNAHWQSEEDVGPPVIGVDPAKGEGSSFTWPNTARLPGDE